MKMLAEDAMNYFIYRVYEVYTEEVTGGKYYSC